MPPQPRFLIFPKPHCTPLGKNVTFRCKVPGDVPLRWCTTGAAARCNVGAEFTNTSSRYRYMSSSNVTISRLHVTASTHYNGSRFKCCYYRDCSEPAKLTVVWPGEHACLPASYLYSYIILNLIYTILSTYYLTTLCSKHYTHGYIHICDCDLIYVGNIERCRQMLVPPTPSVPTVIQTTSMSTTTTTLTLPSASTLSNSSGILYDYKIAKLIFIFTNVSVDTYNDFVVHKIVQIWSECIFTKGYFSFIVYRSANKWG